MYTHRQQNEGGITNSKLVPDARTTMTLRGLVALSCGGPRSFTESQMISHPLLNASRDRGNGDGHGGLRRHTRRAEIVIASRLTTIPDADDRVVARLAAVDTEARGEGFLRHRVGVLRRRVIRAVSRPRPRHLHRLRPGTPGTRVSAVRDALPALFVVPVVAYFFAALRTDHDENE